MENGTNTTGAAALANINLNQIKLDATADQLLLVGQGVANLQSLTLSAVRVINTYDLTEDD